MFFDNIAQRWDNERRIERAKIISDNMISLMRNINYKTGMEFGSGTGLISFNLLDFIENITAVDLSENMLEIIEKKKRLYNITNLKTKNINLLEESLNESYEIIYSSMVLHHVENISLIFDKFYELLEENGELLIVDLNSEEGKFHSSEPEFKGHNGFDHNYLIKKAEESGFIINRMKTFIIQQKKSIMKKLIIHYLYYIALRGEVFCLINKDLTNGLEIMMKVF